MIPQDPDDDCIHLNKCQDCGDFTEEVFCTGCGSFNVLIRDDERQDWDDDDYMFI